MKAVYRIGAAIAAILALPALYFLDIIHYVIDIGFTDGFLDDVISLKDVFGMLSDKTSALSKFEFTPTVLKTLQPLKPSFIVTCVFLGLMLLMVLAVFFCSALTNARKVNICLALVGAVAAIGSMAAFNQMTSLIIGGTVPVGDIVNAFLADSDSALAGIAAMFNAGSLTDVIGEVVLLRLGSAVIAVLLIFIFVALWTGAFVLVDMDADSKAVKAAAKANRKQKSK